MNRAQFQKIQAAYSTSGFPRLCDRNSAECSPSRLATKYWFQVTKDSSLASLARADSLVSALSASGPEEEIYLYCDLHAPKNAVDLDPPAGVEISKGTGPRPPGQTGIVTLATLRSQLAGQYGIRLESTGARASGPVTLIVMQTLDASPTNPYELTIKQFILEPFTGGGQFDLVERDAGAAIDVLDAESGSPITIGSYDSQFGAKGITNSDKDASCLIKTITSDKIYSVVFGPGDAGDGIYSISARTLIPLNPSQTLLPS